MDQVLQAIRELQGQMTRFEDNMNERMTKLETRMDNLGSRMNWDHKKDLHKVKRRVGMEQ